MNIARLDSDVTLLVDEGTLSTELITQATDLAIELGSCQTLTVIVSVDELQSHPDIFSDRWIGAGLDKQKQYVKMRLDIRRPVTPKHDKHDDDRPIRRPARPQRLSVTGVSRTKKRNDDAPGLF
jgi:hypothetical protein